MLRQHVRNAGFAALSAAAAIFVLLGNQRHPAPAASGALPVATATQSSPTEFLRVGLYNVHGGRALDGADNLLQIAEQVRAARLDLVALNEVYGAWRGDDFATQLGQQVGRTALFAPAERRWGRDSFGNGLLTALPLTHWQREPLPRERGNGFRTLLTATVDWQPTPLTVMVTHLDREGDQAEQLQLVAEEFLALEEPVVLLGDLNLSVDDPTLAALLDEPDVVDALSAGGSPLPAGSIEWILARGLDVSDAGSVRSSASDHPLVWVEFRRPGSDPVAKLEP